MIPIINEFIPGHFQLTLTGFGAMIFLLATDSNEVRGISIPVNSRISLVAERLPKPRLQATDSISGNRQPAPDSSSPVSSNSAVHSQRSTELSAVAPHQRHSRSGGSALGRWTLMFDGTRN